VSKKKRWLNIDRGLFLIAFLWAVVATTFLIYTGHSISITFDFSTLKFEIKGGPVEIPAGTVEIENGKAYIKTPEGTSIPWREYWEAQGYTVSYDPAIPAVVAEK